MLPILLTLAACSGNSAPPEPVALIDHAAWVTGRVEVDPQGLHAPDPITCAAGTYHVDGLPPFETFEVTTGDCNFLTASQRTLAPVEAGDALRLIVWHLDLDATLPGPAHAAISIDGDILWELNVDVPSDAALYDVRIDAPRAFTRDADIVFHVHNHGTNEWNIQTVERR
ncbi:MAG: hypothetical protein RMA76_11160 [Deltaproteobacteria bacterium]